jgi:hypothetical protein
MTLRKVHWAKSDIMAVAVQPAARNTWSCEVCAFTHDGLVQRFRDVGASAAEIAMAFKVLSYPDGSGR